MKIFKFIKLINDYESTNINKTTLFFVVTPFLVMALLWRTSPFRGSKTYFIKSKTHWWKSWIICGGTDCEIFSRLQILWTLPKHSTLLGNFSKSYGSIFQVENLAPISWHEKLETSFLASNIIPYDYENFRTPEPDRRWAGQFYKHELYYFCSDSRLGNSHDVKNISSSWQCNVFI